MHQENVVLAEIKAGANASGYVYLYLRKHLCEAFGIRKGTVLIVIYHDGRFSIQKKE